MSVPVRAMEGIDPQARGAAAALRSRNALMAWLADPASRQILLGQNCGHGEGNAGGYQRAFAEAAPRMGGLVPMICGVDYGWDRLEPGPIAAANAVLVGHWRRGGLAEVSMHPSNPCTGRGTQSCEGMDFDALLTPGTEAHRRWMADLKAAGDGLAALREEGVAVLWRPLHEANGGWFWWCSDRMPGGAWTKPGDFIRLWRQMHHYLAVERGLDNLVWVYAANARIDPRIRPVTEYYPGADVVDVVGFDVYATAMDAATLNADGGYGQLADLGKPVAVTEIGPPRNATGTLDGMAVLEAVRRVCPRARYVFWWQSWQERVLGVKWWRKLGLADNPRGAELLADPRVRSLAWER